MAARKNKIHPDGEWVERTRQSIQTGMLIKSLTEHVEGKKEMVPSQVTAALGLLKKTIPDLTASDNKTEVNHNYVARMPAPVKDGTDWQQQHAAPLKNQTLQ